MHISPTARSSEPALLHIDITGDVRRREVVLSGEVDMRTADQLRDALRGCAAMGSELVVLDVAEMGFLAVAGLTALVDARETLTASGSSLVIVHADRATARVLRLTGLASMLAADHALVDSGASRPTAAPSDPSAEAIAAW